MGKLFGIMRGVAITVAAALSLSACADGGMGGPRNLSPAAGAKLSVDPGEIGKVRTKLKSMLLQTVVMPVPFDPVAARPEIKKGTLAWYGAYAMYHSPTAIEATLGNGGKTAEDTKTRMESVANGEPTSGDGAQSPIRDEYGITAMLRLNVTDFGASANRNERDRASLQALMQTSRGQTEGVILCVALAMYDVAWHRDAAIAAGEALLRAKEVRKSVASASRPEADVAYAEARVAAAVGRYHEARKQAADSEDRFARVVGIRPDVVILPDPAESGAGATRAESEALAENHPLVAVAAANLLASVSNALAVDSERFGWLGMDLGPAGWVDVVGGGVTPWSIGVAFLKKVGPMFDSGDQDWRIVRVATQVQQALAQHEDAVNKAHIAIDEAWNQSDASRGIEKAATTEAAELEKVVAAYGEEMKCGKRSVADVLNSSDELLKARLKVASAHYSGMAGAYRVSAAQGTLAKASHAVDWTEAKSDGKDDPFARIAAKRGGILYEVKDKAPDGKAQDAPAVPVVAPPVSHGSAAN